MKVDIYKSKEKSNKFVAVEAGVDISGKGCGIEDNDFAIVIPAKKGVELESGLIGINIVQAEKDILEKKHYIFSIGVTVDVQIQKD